LGCQVCEKYQDVASVRNKRDIYSNGGIDSVAMIANDSIIGCREYWHDFMVIGSKAHRVKFPINVRVQLFSQGDLWKEFFVEMEKNTELTIFTGHDCSYDTFPPRLKAAKEQNRFIDFSFTDDYCWLLERMVDSHDHMHCTELSVDGEQPLCRSI
jgi:hypothetical protein